MGAFGGYLQQVCLTTAGMEGRGCVSISFATCSRHLRSQPSLQLPTPHSPFVQVWTKLRTMAAAALAAEGIGSVVLEGSLAQVTAAMRSFATAPPSEVKVLLLALGTDCSGLTLCVGLRCVRGLRVARPCDNACCAPNSAPRSPASPHSHLLNSTAANHLMVLDPVR